MGVSNTQVRACAFGRVCIPEVVWGKLHGFGSCFNLPLGAPLSVSSGLASVGRLWGALSSPL